MPPASSLALHLSETNRLGALVCRSERSALMSSTRKVTPFSMTACYGSGNSVAAEHQPSQIPSQNGMQRPPPCHVRTPQSSWRYGLHWLSSKHIGAKGRASIPYWRDTQPSTS